jgi:L-amino acid N-acyltransferase YncA
MGTEITAATAADFDAILAIYNEVIRNSTAVYTEEEYTAVRGEVWFRAKLESGHPFIVARESSQVVGFAAFGEFRAWPCYRNTVEHSVHVRSDRRGCGIGRALLLELLALARSAGKHVMIAGIDADNAASIGLHERLGFTVAGRFHEVGFKFGRWLDLVFMERTL